VAQLGEASEAEDRLSEATRLVEDLAARDIVAARGAPCHALGRVCLLLGRLDEARRLGDQIVEISSRQPGDAAYARHLLGDIATRPDLLDADLGEANYRKSLALAEPLKMRPLIAHCHLGLGRLARLVGRHQRAREHLILAATMYREMDMTFWVARADAELRS
jgi:tetratricopeptide (TPR) repeat protein